jgi:predicted regulator of Ras-like GTPase activity (Roadblock/LC7/MglB family)
MSDEVRRLSDELARDPASLAFLPLADALRRAGNLELALRVAMRGLDRHPYLADAHDVLARIHADRGEMQRAADEWGMALGLRPDLASARKGLAFVAFRDGRLEEAREQLSRLATEDGDESVGVALERVQAALDAGARAPAAGDADTATTRAPVGAPVRVATPPPRAADPAPAAAPRQPSLTPAPTANTDARSLFRSIEAPGRSMLLLDADGLVLAGRHIDEGGGDRAEEIGAELAGVSGEASRAMRFLGLGAWSSLVVESERATVAMSPAPRDGLVLVTTSQETPGGLVRVYLERALTRSRRWLETLT